MQRRAAEQADEAVDRPRSGPTGHGGGALRVPALRRAPCARSLSTVFDRPCCEAGMTTGLARSVLFVAASVCVACDGITTVASSVLSVDRSPVAGAIVAVTNAPRPISCVTDSAGACEVKFGHGGWYNRYAVEVTLAGFKAARAEAWAGRRMRCQATLVPTAN